VAKYDVNQLTGLAYQAEASAHDIFSQFLGGPSSAQLAAEVAIQQGREASKQAEAAAAAAQAKADQAQAVGSAMSQNYTMIAVGVLAIALIVAVARR